jgi:uncharacterized SAM-binding protein YcdF (DUF218 family)
MFFLLSKTLGWLLSPMNALALMLVAGVLLMLKGKRRAAACMVSGVTLVIVAVTCTPLPQLTIRPLEQAYATPPTLPSEIAGIVIIGGTERIAAVEGYGMGEMAAAPDTMTFARLAREYPHAKLLFAGGSGYTLQRGVTEAAVLKNCPRSSVLMGGASCWNLDRATHTKMRYSVKR